MDASGAASSVVPVFAELEERLTTAPPGGIVGPTPWRRKKTDSGFTVTTSRHSSSVTSKSGVSRMIPAALTR